MYRAPVPYLTQHEGRIKTTIINFPQGILNNDCINLENGMHRLLKNPLSIKNSNDVSLKMLLVIIILILCSSLYLWGGE